MISTRQHIRKVSQRLRSRYGYRYIVEDGKVPEVDLREAEERGAIGRRIDAIRVRARPPTVGRPDLRQRGQGSEGRANDEYEKQTRTRAIREESNADEFNSSNQGVCCNLINGVV